MLNEWFKSVLIKPKLYMEKKKQNNFWLNNLCVASQYFVLNFPLEVLIKMIKIFIRKASII